MANIPDEIADDEYLYRGVTANCYSSEHKRASSAAFKDSGGMSVDRDGGRDCDTCVSRLCSSGKSFVAVARFKASVPRKVGNLVLYKPIANINPYHSEVHESDTVLKLTGSHAHNISSACETITTLEEAEESSQES